MFIILYKLDIIKFLRSHFFYCVSQTRLFVFNVHKATESFVLLLRHKKCSRWIEQIIVHTCYLLIPKISISFFYQPPYCIVSFHLFSFFSLCKCTNFIWNCKIFLTFLSAGSSTWNHRETQVFIYQYSKAIGTHNTSLIFFLQSSQPNLQQDLPLFFFHELLPVPFLLIYWYMMGCTNSLFPSVLPLQLIDS